MQEKWMGGLLTNWTQADKQKTHFMQYFIYLSKNYVGSFGTRADSLKSVLFEFLKFRRVPQLYTFFEFKSNLAPEQQLDLNPSSSFQSCNQDLQTESSPRIEHGSNSDHKHNSTAPLNHIQHTIKPSSTDTDSAMGLVSELSQLSHQQRQPQQPPIPLQDGFASSNQQIIIEEQVQKGIEKVLVAILEAGKNQTISNENNCLQIYFNYFLAD